MNKNGIFGWCLCTEDQISVCSWFITWLRIQNTTPPVILSSASILITNLILNLVYLFYSIQYCPLLMCPILLYLTVSSCTSDFHLSFDCCIHYFLLKGASQCWEPEGCSESIWDGCRRWEKEITILALQLPTPLCYCTLNYTTLLCTTIPCLTK